MGHRITSENARILALKSAQVRRQLRDERKYAAEHPHEPERTPDADADRFTEKRLVRIRKQLSLIDDEIEKELKSDDPDGQKVDRLAAASMRINDQEFALANRPKPAPLKMSARQARTYQQPSTQPPPTATE